MEQNYNIYCYDRGNRDINLYSIKNVPQHLLKEIVDLLSKIYVTCEIAAEIIIKPYIKSGNK